MTKRARLRRAIAISMNYQDETGGKEARSLRYDTLYKRSRQEALEAITPKNISARKLKLWQKLQG